MTSTSGIFAVIYTSLEFSWLFLFVEKTRRNKKRREATRARACGGLSRAAGRPTGGYTIWYQKKTEENRRPSAARLYLVPRGSGLIPGFEESLLSAKADTDISLEIAAADAYGEKNSEMIDTMSIDKLLRYVRDPKSLYIGGPVTIDRRTGTLSYLAAGRARIDYNHPMAGRTLKYDYKIVKVITDKKEKVAALLESNTGHEGFEVSFDGDDISIITPEAMLFDTNAAMQKFRIVTVLRDSVDAGKVSFVEVHEPRVASEEEE